MRIFIEISTIWAKVGKYKHVKDLWNILRYLIEAKYDWKLQGIAALEVRIK
tara:strand:- start:2459 stop:2611 length:153 start_codon:yes stop_codon:yes gene_type:complete